MRPNAPSGCITRLVVDGTHDLELAELQGIMQRIQGALRHLVPPAQQPYVGNALLNLAVSHMLRETGSQRTATILIRLVDSVLEHDGSPPPGSVIDLTASHA